MGEASEWWIMRTWTRRGVGAAGIGAALFLTREGNAQPSDAAATLTSLLGMYVSESEDGVNKVAYGRWRAKAAEIKRLDEVVVAFQRQTPARMAKEEAIAFWANLYNAVTLQVVLRHYPVRSIRDIKSEGAIFDAQALMGPWRTKRVLVEGQRLSLDDMEHQILRPLARDPRIHYAVNCASIGCPNLLPKAWSAHSLDDDLNHAARAFVNHPRAASLIRGALRVSSIYEWFKEDFGANDSGVIAHLNHFADSRLAHQLSGVTRISSHTYNWDLNEAS